MVLLISGRGAWQRSLKHQGVGEGLFKELGRFDGNLDIVTTAFKTSLHELNGVT